MQRSEEIRRVIERWLVANRDGDIDAIFGRMSQATGTLAIGSDAGEWWHEDELSVWRRQLEELGRMPVTFEPDAIEAWEEETVGWAAGKVTIDAPEGQFEARGTYVLHLERGEWKIVQVHWSLPNPNTDLWDVPLPVSLEELEERIRLERPDLSETTAADGTVTIVFTDIVDSTPLTARLGDRAWLEIVRRHNDVIRETTTAHGGTVVETQGDGSMLAFSSARRAVACAQAIQGAIATEFAEGSAPIRVRIGLHTGDALHEADHFYGTTVNYAARVAGQALGGEILVSNLVHELVAGAGVTFVAAREVELKGIDGPQWLWALTWT